jgi:hypothetical protein
MNHPWLQQQSFHQAAPFAPAFPQYQQPGTPIMHSRPATGQSAFQSFNAAGAYVQEPQLPPPGTAQQPSNQAAPAHSLGYHFSMSAVADIEEVLQHSSTFTSLENVLQYALPKDKLTASGTVAAATRASTKRQAGDSVVQHAPKPKSFIAVPPQLPKDGNSNRLSRPPHVAGEPLSISEQSVGDMISTPIQLLWLGQVS